MAKATASFIPTAGTSSEDTGLLDRLSDLLSPIVVKEVRQMVRGREFNYSFSLSIVAGLLVAFVVGTGATAGTGDAGSRIFGSLMTCLTIVGIVVAPLGAFNALRNERMERTLDLVTVTTLSARRIVIGKLAAQAVKLATLFAALAPFVAMSFLLGGVDFLTIVLSLSALFMWSLWACAAALFLSCLSRSRAVSALIFGGMIISFLLLLSGSGLGFFLARSFLGPPRFGGPSPSLFTSTGTDLTWTLLAMALFCIISMANLVLLAENRLRLPTEDRSTALRIGFLFQFLLIVAIVVVPILMRSGVPVYISANSLALLGGLQLAAVALFSVTEELVLSRRIVLQIHGASGWRRYLTIFRPGGARGAVYVLAQMILFLGVGATFLSTSDAEFTRLLAICGYICFFTGVPVCIGRIFLPQRLKTLQLRIGVVLLLPLVTLLPDFLVYLVTGDFGGIYSSRHVLDPFRTLSNWRTPMTAPWHFLSMGICVIGVGSYLLLIQMGRQAAMTNETAN